VQARLTTAGVPGDEHAERGARRHALAGDHRRGHRLVRSPQATGVADADHSPTGDPAGEVHHALARGADGHPDLASEINTSVPGEPGPRWWLEVAEQPRHAIERPPEPARRGAGRRKG